MTIIIFIIIVILLVKTFRIKYFKKIIIHRTANINRAPPINPDTTEHYFNYFDTKNVYVSQQVSFYCPMPMLCGRSLIMDDTHDVVRIHTSNTDIVLLTSLPVHVYLQGVPH